MRKVAVTLLALLSGGCAALNTVHWRFPGPEESTVFTTDAMQRHLIMVKDPEHSGRIKVCAEASPDAMSVFTTALATRGSLGATERAGDAAFGLGQTASTVERTQTINLLRESMYRTCERWLSGALTDDQFLTLAARDHRSMVAVLAIEQLTGVVKPPATIISGPAAQAALAQSETTVELLKTYQEDRKKADEAALAAEKAYAELNVDHDNDPATAKLCELTTKPQAGGDNFDKCAPAKATWDGAKAIAKTANEREDKVIAQLNALSGGLSSGVSAGNNNPGGLGKADRPSDATLIAMSDMVGKIALTAGVDEALMFCVGYLKGTQDDSTRETCNQVLLMASRSDAVVTDAAAGLGGASLGVDFARYVQNPLRPRTGLDFNLFRAQLIFNIRATAADRLKPAMTRLETAAGLAAGTMSNDCETTAGCLRAVDDNSLSLSNAFQSPEIAEKMNAALQGFGRE